MTEEYLVTCKSYKKHIVKSYRVPFEIISDFLNEISLCHQIIEVKVFCSKDKK